MKISKKKLRKIIKEEYRRILQEKPPADMHRCMDGAMVPYESHDCLDDIMNRIEDAEYHRGSHSCGTEDRIYYNGLLKGLRNKRNRLKKILVPPIELEIVEEIPSEID